MDKEHSQTGAPGWVSSSLEQTKQSQHGEDGQRCTAQDIPGSCPVLTSRGEVRAPAPQERLLLRERAWEDLMATTRKLEEEKQQAGAHILELEEEVLAATTALQTAEQYIEAVELSEATLTDQIVTREQAVQEMLQLVQQQVPWAQITAML